MMQKIMMNLTLETCGNGFVPAVWCNCDKISFFFGQVIICIFMFLHG